jgi:hypothetical protein
MRIGAIEVVKGEEHTKLACATCGTQVTQSKMLSDYAGSAVTTP